MGAGDPPSKILNNVIPVDGVEEFIYWYLGSKHSSNGYCLPDVLRRIGLACSVMNYLQMVWIVAVLPVSAPKFTCTLIRSVLL